jgi:[protein-PII] uridylyltransferase
MHAGKIVMRHSPAHAKTFAESLPPSYRAGFDWAAIAEHAALSQRRRPGHPAVGTCFAARLPGHTLCVVADDRPGLLATISAALISERLDVNAAEAYTRRVSDSQREAIDIFWVHQVDVADPERPLSDGLVTHLESTLDQLLDEHYDPKDARIPTQPPPARGESCEAIVRFIEDKSGTLTTLEVETNDRTGMLLVLSRALYAQQVQIVSSTVRTEKGRVRDRFLVTELDDTPIRPERRLLVQMAVLEAIQQTFGR